MINTVQERFWAKVDKGNGAGCWLWTAGTAGEGYGAFWPEHRQMVYAHRYAYELLVGLIADGYEVDHLCRVRRCVRVDHLEVVTPEENRRRGLMVKVAKTHCRRGHLREVPRRDRCRQCQYEYRRAWRLRRKEAGQTVV